MNWKSKRVLVTGAGGFIGSHLTEALVRSGANTRAFVRYNSAGRWGWLDSSDCQGDVDVVAGDIFDQGFVKQAMKDIDVVFHLAALIAIPYSYVAPEAYVQTNVLGTLNVLQAARELGIERLVHTSTSEVYGTAQYVPIDEKHPLQGQSPYSASKIAADKMVESFYCSFDLPVVTVRPFNTFGPRQSARAVIPAIITQCLTGNTVKLGSLHPTRDMNYVENTVEGFLNAASSKEAIGQVVNVGSGREISIGDLAQLIIKLTGGTAQLETDEKRLRPLGSEVERLLADSSRAQSLLGWSAKVSLEDGLSQTIEWIRENSKIYRSGYVV